MPTRIAGIAIGLTLIAAGCGKQDDNVKAGAAVSGGAKAAGGPAPSGAKAGATVSGGAKPAGGPAPSGSQADAGAALAGAKAEATAGGKKLFSYPPPGKGPYEGFDLAALRDKLQGTWLVGGSAFSSIPTIWHVEGDELTQINAKGERSENTLEIIAPCELAVANSSGSTVFETFVFDGDTLYQGLGFAGVKEGDRTVACVAAGVYVLQGDTCTKWTRRPFARKGQPRWQSEPGECGYEKDGAVFWGDDTNSKRKIYGKESLSVSGNVLMTRQMKANKAEKVASLEEAIAKQKALIQAQEELKHPPKDLAFPSWGLTPSGATYQKGDKVWAAAVSRQKRWTFNIFRYQEAEGDILKVSLMSDHWAPSAFTRATQPATGLAPRTPVMIAAGASVSYGRFSKMNGDKVVIRSLSGNKVSDREVAADRVAAIVPGRWMLGAPVAYKNGDMWQAGEAVLAAADKVYVVTGDGVKPLAKEDVELIDVSRPLRKGNRVSAMEASGFAPLKFVPGKIQQVLDDGVAYEIKTDEGKVFLQTYARVMKKK